MSILRGSILVSFALASLWLLVECGGGGSSSSANAQALCMQGCTKVADLCAAQFMIPAATPSSVCNSQCASSVGTSTTTCTNSSAVIAAYQACLNQRDTTCDQFMTCVEGVPACTGGGTGGSSGGGTGGRAGGSTGGSSGGGTGGRAGGGTGGSTGLPTGTCADLVTCCNSIADAATKAGCLQVEGAIQGMVGANITQAQADSACAAGIPSFCP